LAVDPRLLLLDEPFGALDTKVRKDLRGELRRIHDAAAVTTILVTHDQDEAMALADRVVLMNAGRIEQVGTPMELDREPATPFAFEFLGQTNRLPCEVVAGVARFEGFASPAFGAGATDGAGLALFRPHDTVLDPDLEMRGMTVRVASIGGRGASGLVECVTPGGDRITAEMPRGDASEFRVGQEVKLTARRVLVGPDAAGGLGIQAAGPGSAVESIGNARRVIALPSR
jgi:sulfate transport system ATP-binding protein